MLNKLPCTNLRYKKANYFSQQTLSTATSKGDKRRNSASNSVDGGRTARRNSTSIDNSGYLDAFADKMKMPYSVSLTQAHQLVLERETIPQSDTIIETKTTKNNPLSSSPVKPMTTKNTPGERLQRSRERNRIHARKTRQRKKEQMQNLQNRAQELKDEQIRLKQIINEKATASILVGLFSKDCKSDGQRVEDPRVEGLLRRPVDSIPDASKLPELPALILPGQHNSKKHKAPDAVATKEDLPNDGIDYELLGKDRSKCTPEELDQIRRERNRMHAKRTRDRKRLFVEEMADMCSKLEEENKVLQGHLDGLNGKKLLSISAGSSLGDSPILSSKHPSVTAPPLFDEQDPSKCQPSSEHGVTFDQIKTLLEAAGKFTPSNLPTSPVPPCTSASEGGSLSDDDHFSSKRRKLIEADNVSSTLMSSTVPMSITTTAL